MIINKKYHCGYVIFELRGEVSNPKILNKIEKTIDKEILSDSIDDIAIDLHNTEYINSGLIRYFIAWKKLCDKNKKNFCLIEPSEMALDVLETTGIPKIVTVYKTEVEFSQSV